MRVDIGRAWHGQINAARRLPPGPPLTREERKDIWTALLMYLIARKK